MENEYSECLVCQMLIKNGEPVFDELLMGSVVGYVCKSHTLSELTSANILHTLVIG